MAENKTQVIFSLTEVIFLLKLELNTANCVNEELRKKIREYETTPNIMSEELKEKENLLNKYKDEIKEKDELIKTYEVELKKYRKDEAKRKKILEVFEEVAKKGAE